MATGIISTIYSAFAKSSLGQAIADREVNVATEKGGVDAGKIEREAWDAAAEGEVGKSWRLGTQALKAVTRVNSR